MVAATFPSERRNQDISESLLRAAYELKIVFKRTLVIDEWRLGILVKVDTFDNKTDTIVSFLEENKPNGRFLYDGTSPFLNKNSIISYNGDLISLPDAKNLEPVTLRVKWLR